MHSPRKTVTATEMKNRFGDYLNHVVRKREPVLVEKHGKPVAVIVRFDDWKGLEAKRVEREHPWIRKCRELADRIDKNHPDSKPFSAVDLMQSIREEYE
ncbi:MAG: type II toxin-antitoxin system Phd/YefM family antitoxin [Deltaproteobacteria bacterium]|nr:type II toxin-antitoxin system Phd/YefM family antitoxin [Deltaproteobacteria bacterium]MBI2500766.1 type II toxin-antitoxin system Phd/YefM family antitoxin [Deltaproteobacteria bacterium]MBI4197281.1 type II toxin-antitoxin system Phd/YefM family antitoxin [Deltaproteobacteria bacterium]